MRRAYLGHAPEAAGAARPVMRSEEELVRAAQRGDEAAFGELVGRHRDRLHRILRRTISDEDAAEDAIQDALLRAWRNIGRFQGRSGFFTWLTRIAINEAHRTRERAQARPTEPLDDAVGERVPAWGGQPDEIFRAREFLRAIEQALRDLPEDHRAAVVLRDIEGFSTAEAAAILEIEEAAMKSRLHRGRMALRRTLDGYFNGG